MQCLYFLPNRSQWRIQILAYKRFKEKVHAETSVWRDRITAPWLSFKLRLCILFSQAAFKLYQMLISQPTCNDSKVSFSVVSGLLCFSPAASAYCMATLYCLRITATNPSLFLIIYYFCSCIKKYAFSFPFKCSDTRRKCYHFLHICGCYICSEYSVKENR